MWMPGRKCGAAQAVTLAFLSPGRSGSQYEIKVAALHTECIRDLGGVSHSSRVAMPRAMGRNNRGFSLDCVQIHSSLENLKNYGVALNSRLSCAGLARVPSAIGGNSLSAATQL